MGETMLEVGPAPMRETVREALQRGNVPDEPAPRWSCKEGTPTAAAPLAMVMSAGRGKFPDKGPVACRFEGPTPMGETVREVLRRSCEEDTNGRGLKN